MTDIREQPRRQRDPMAGMNRKERRDYLKKNRFVSFTFKLPRTALERLKVIPGRTDEERIACAIDAAIKQFERLRGNGPIAVVPDAEHVVAVLHAAGSELSPLTVERAKELLDFPTTEPA